MQYEAIKKRRLVIQAKFFPNNEDRVVSDDRALMHEGWVADAAVRLVLSEIR
jgi:hypothetical protein